MNTLIRIFPTLIGLTLTGAGENAVAARNIEAALITPNLENCETARAAVIDSRFAIVDVVSPCHKYMDGTQGQLFLRVMDDGSAVQIINAGASVATSACEGLLSALAGAPFNVDQPTAISGRCMPANTPGRSRAILQLDHFRRYDAAMPMKTAEACEEARSDLLAFGIGVDLQPARCRSFYGDGAEETPFEKLQKVVDWIKEA